MSGQMGEWSQMEQKAPLLVQPRQAGVGVGPRTPAAHPPTVVSPTLSVPDFQDHLYSLSIPKSRINTFRFSYFVNAPLVWNQLPPHHLQSLSLSTLNLLSMHLQDIMRSQIPAPSCPPVVPSCWEPADSCSHQLAYSQEHTVDHKSVSDNIWNPGASTRAD